VPTDKKHVLSAAEGFTGFILSLSKYQRLDSLNIQVPTSESYNATQKLDLCNGVDIGLVNDLRMKTMLPTG
jgi:hypothetical protein